MHEHFSSQPKCQARMHINQLLLTFGDDQLGDMTVTVAHYQHQRQINIRASLGYDEKAAATLLRVMAKENFLFGVLCLEDGPSGPVYIIKSTIELPRYTRDEVRSIIGEVAVMAMVLRESVKSTC